MSTLAWIIVNIALLGSAVVTVKLAKELPKEMKTEQQQLLEKEKPNLKKPKDKETAKDAKQTKTAKQTPPEQTTPPIRTGFLDDIWKKSLFNPDRTELTETNNTQPETTEQITNSELELSAILQLGDKAVAVIKQKQQQRGRGGRQQGGSNRPGMPQFGGNMPGGGRFGGNMPGGGRFGGNMPGMPPWMQQQQQQPEQPKPQGKKIFRVGEEINDTGYTVKDIIPAERTCIVTKNGRDEILTMEFGDSQSAGRKQEAVNYQKEVIAKAEAAARQNNQNNQNNQNRWDRRRMMMNGPGGMQGGPGMWRGGPGGMQGGPGMWRGGPGGTGDSGMMGNPGGFNRGGQQGNTPNAPNNQSNNGGGNQSSREQNSGINSIRPNGSFQPWSIQRR